MSKSPGKTREKLEKELFALIWAVKFFPHVPKRLELSFKLIRMRLRQIRKSVAVLHVQFFM